MYKYPPYAYGPYDAPYPNYSHQPNSFAYSLLIVSLLLLLIFGGYYLYYYK